ncbi:protein-L-isoaspartate O-methyltransferase [Geobacter metallireducens RCH3]|uniref:Protein-L-isoaspartate O-methyltransferase n=1 Tax=Geobacter metallireducens (strain ATCC 53774 / DSM 7210 / GS-15) TaxID=269799 RepID=PIMT_GEOMG|nr:protein-L-isoaspartate(D-aspartate) O-methyltransferase [Geobacter metallireducens]Q39VS0.1 RecName: Full=Protein-L-isoaspartate O-methyltransferase; AltName: Full=L-isoaspartyl protein carboxyl methyltransferase; AltName: Full=Protein L-isoaspartyl methyltransferase; AltName: Full=Protein-beta-aspartate methyltransferase; Short=PIMT [Geobacter metallireducens GS-15]ABB31654.1 protein L-isoaspartate O-methyltransferase [Geobacter metallireducens GS-15]EHP89468.1 protein-L-isoaspartate O-methy
MNFDIARKRMVETQIISRGVKDRRLIEAMLKVPRHVFVEEAMAAQAYSDTPLPIGEKQTISQPYMVALMTELLELSGREKVLEIGTGSGYQAAILATLADRVYTVERIRPLALKARRALDRLGLLNVNIKISDGTIGWEEEAPFDAIIVTAGAPDVPDKLAEQLAVGGRLVIPVGNQFDQVLVRITKQEDGSLIRENVTGCRFVKLVGKYGWGTEE